MLFFLLELVFPYTISRFQFSPILRSPAFVFHSPHNTTHRNGHRNGFFGVTLRLFLAQSANFLCCDIRYSTEINHKKQEKQDISKYSLQKCLRIRRHCSSSSCWPLPPPSPSRWRGWRRHRRSARPGRSRQCLKVTNLL